MCSCPKAAITNSHQFGGLKHRNLFSHNSGCQKREVKVSLGPPFFPRFRRRVLPCLLKHWVPSVIPWIVAATLQSLPLSSHSFSFCLLLLFSYGHLSMVLGPTQVTQGDLILKPLIMSSKTHFPNKIKFTGTEGQYKESHYSTHCN